MVKTHASCTSLFLSKMFFDFMQFILMIDPIFYIATVTTNIANDGYFSKQRD